MPDIVSLRSARNIFLFEEDSETLGVDGYLMMVFGLTSYTLIEIGHHFDSSRDIDQGYRVLNIKPYATILPGNDGEMLTAVIHVESITKTQRSGFPLQVYTFLLGASAN